MSNTQRTPVNVSPEMAGLIMLWLEDEKKELQAALDVIFAETNPHTLTSADALAIANMLQKLEDIFSLMAELSRVQ